jgi:hypothetical protein
MARVLSAEPTTSLTEAHRMRLYLLGRGLQHSRSPEMRNGIRERGESWPGSLVAGGSKADADDQGELAGRWTALPVTRDPLLDAVDLHGAHDFRHTFATWG